ncbi:glycosyltransferase [Pseudoroseicyclus sp. CXY001]|uniref:glycosyltransferase family 2 protein n=1 Tax=Pseudoroseicyclus sp. CXY001 TaxID=3242492 RepID=UPI00358DAC83
MEEIFFSVVMATYNRAGLIARAIDAVLAQHHRAFELIIVDDASTDETGALIASRYAAEIEEGRISYVRLPQNRRAPAARNVGLAIARGPWIAYADSDNAMRPGCLAAYARALKAAPEARFAYAKIAHMSDGREMGRPFDRAALLKRNYIDMGVIVHHRDLYLDYGGIDMRQSIYDDWELALRYSAVTEPLFIDEVVLDYDDFDDRPRVSRVAHSARGVGDIRRSFGIGHPVATLVYCRNAVDGIRETLLSVLRQIEVASEIVVYDDGSTDGTVEAIEALAEQYPFRIELMRAEAPVGRAAAFAALLARCKGEHIALLEAPDRWTDNRRLELLSAYLTVHPDCPMVLDGVQVAGEECPRGAGLPEKVTGQALLDDPWAAPLATLSGAVLRRSVAGVLAELPEGPGAGAALAFALEREGPLGSLGSVLTETGRAGDDRASHLVAALPFAGAPWRAMIEDELGAGEALRSSA